MRSCLSLQRQAGWYGRPLTNTQSVKTIEWQTLTYGTGTVIRYPSSQQPTVSNATFSHAHHTTVVGHTVSKVTMRTDSGEGRTDWPDEPVCLRLNALPPFFALGNRLLVHVILHTYVPSTCFVRLKND